MRKNKQRELTIGVDVGDKTSRYCVLDREGNVLFERSTATTKKGWRKLLPAWVPVASQWKWEHIRLG